MNWKQEKIFTPKRFAGQVPVYQVIARYSLKEGEEELLVDRVFAACQESLKITFQNTFLREQIGILEGKICFVTSKYILPFPHDARQRNLSWKEVEPLLDLHFNPPKMPLPSYQHIKKYEEQLKLLPWQEDLEAIYAGNGIFLQLRLCAKIEPQQHL